MIKPLSFKGSLRVNKLRKRYYVGRTIKEQVTMSKKITTGDAFKFFADCS